MKTDFVVRAFRWVCENKAKVALIILMGLILIAFNELR